MLECCRRRVFNWRSIKKSEKWCILRWRVPVKTVLFCFILFMLFYLMKMLLTGEYEPSNIYVTA